MLKLLLLALEREEIVSVGYREEVIGQRLLQMPIPEEVRDVIRKALIWVWKDEEMHTIYIRGALLKVGNLRLRTQALLQQIAGAIGGWSSSILQHTTWRQAPLSRLTARAFTAAGVLMGKVTSSVWEELRHKPFREFCLFNVDAEKTAALCWKRLTEISSQCGDFPHATLDEMRKMQLDEENHTRIFELLANALDGEDRLHVGVDAGALAAQMHEVGPSFVERRRRAVTVQDNPLGTGGDVLGLEGQSAAEKLPLFRRLLTEAGLDDVLRERAERAGKSIAELSVAIKTSFMMGYHRQDLSPLVDAELLKELALHRRCNAGRDPVCAHWSGRERCVTLLSCCAAWEACCARRGCRPRLWRR